MSSRKLIVGAALVVSAMLGSSAPAFAGHDHYILTPNGKCHRVAAGQTAINDPAHGGYHRYHANVHLGATESSAAPDNLGDGRAATAVYKRGPAPAVCDGD